MSDTKRLLGDDNKTSNNAANQSNGKQILDSGNSHSQANINQEDDDNDCWDDAKEDHQLEDLPTLNQTTKTSLPSSSSAYSNNKSSNLFSNPTKDESLILHEAIFNNDSNRIYEILKNEKDPKNIINKKDKHGNTPLHLACMLGRSKMLINVLLQSGATIDSKNLNRWTPFHEACSYGNREVITLMTKQLKNDIHEALNKYKLSENLEKTKNYRLVLKWEFQSWVPFLSRVLPSDVCVINKQGKFIRIDTRLLDFEMLSWKKGESCLIYSDKFEKKWIILNNKTKKYQHVETENIDKDLDDKVDEFMSTDIIDLELKSSDIQMTRSTQGWIWKADKIEKVGKYNASLYNFNNVFLVTRKRREHLTEEEVKRNKVAYKSAMHVLKFGKKPNLKEIEDAASQEYETSDENNDNCSDNQEDAEDTEINHRESLVPPPPTNVTWNEYCDADAGKFPTLGREQRCKTTKTAFRASVAMSEEFPITKKEFLDLLSIVPLKPFKKLKEFIEMRLPDGFPIRLDIPVFPFLSARITFEEFSFVDDTIDESLFRIPDDYEEDRNLFPLLSSKLK